MNKPISAVKVASSDRIIRVRKLKNKEFIINKLKSKIK